MILGKTVSDPTSSTTQRTKQLNYKKILSVLALPSLVFDASDASTNIWISTYCSFVVTKINNKVETAIVEGMIAILPLGHSILKKHLLAAVIDDSLITSSIIFVSCDSPRISQNEKKFYHSMIV